MYVDVDNVDGDFSESFFLKDKNLKKMCLMWITG
jgi:hypothetical protein